MGGSPTSTESRCCAARRAWATVIKEVALLLMGNCLECENKRMPKKLQQTRIYLGMGDDAGDAGDPGEAVSPGVPGGVPTLPSPTNTAGLPGRVSEEIDTDDNPSSLE